MVHLNVMSREEAKAASSYFSCKTAVISINDNDEEEIDFNKSSNYVDALYLHFLDTDKDCPEAMSAVNADAVRDFLKINLTKIDRLIVHCSFGVSRSSGIAAAILKALTGNDFDIFNDPWYRPNMLCYRRVLDSLMDDEGNLIIDPCEMVYSGKCHSYNNCVNCLANKDDWY